MRSDIESCSLRFFNVYGPGQSSEGGYAAVIPAFKKAISLGKECTIFGDGTQVRDFVHVHDLVRIIGLCLETRDLPREMNVASGTGVSLLELVETLNELNPEMLPPTFAEERAGDIHTSVADISLLLSTLQVGEMITLKEAFREYRLAFFKGIGLRFVFNNPNPTRNGLVSKGHSVDFYSPGKSVANSFNHHSIERSSRRGSKLEA